jgi:dipeptidase
MHRRTVVIILALALLLSAGLCAQNKPRTPLKDEGGCYSIIVGKDASATGSVIMAHNEDDVIPQIVNHHKIPHQIHASGETVQLGENMTLSQVPETYGYIWSEMPGLLYSDSYLNQNGVCICSNACPSREDRPELVGDGISNMLRRLVAQRAKSSREGVHLAGKLIEQFGYTGSGRTYIICDPREGWLFCAVNGKHWVAARVPDNQVALVANTYTVQTVNLADTMNFLGCSDDIKSYATRRGWYHPDTDGPFNFAKAYADSGAAVDPRNIARQWDGIRLIAATPPNYGDPLPVSILPAKKVDVKKLMTVLRSHYEGTVLFDPDLATGNPHNSFITPICHHETQTSFIAELRDNMPLDIGLVYWVCLSNPCVSTYIPYYYGIDPFPISYMGPSVAPTDSEYQARMDKPFAVDTCSLYWSFTSLQYHAEKNYIKSHKAIRKVFDEAEKKAINKQGDADRVMNMMMDAAGRNKMDPKILRMGFTADYCAALEALTKIKLP